MRGAPGVLLCCALTAGCASSPPMRYYTLSESVPRGTSAASASGLHAPYASDATSVSTADAQGSRSAPANAPSTSPPAASAANAQTTPSAAANDAGASAPDARATSSGRVGIRVGRVALPGEIDRTQLVYRVDANRLRITEMDRWAAPLDEMIRRVLTDNLAARLSPSAGIDPASVLTLEIQEFFGDANCAVTLRASWTLAGPKPRSSPGVDVVRVPSAGACPDALPIGMSTAIGELSDRIVADLQAPSS